MYEEKFDVKPSSTVEDMKSDKEKSSLDTTEETKEDIQTQRIEEDDVDSMEEV